MKVIVRVVPATTAPDTVRLAKEVLETVHPTTPLLHKQVLASVIAV